MSDNELSRLKGDLAVMQKAMGLRLSFGRGMLIFGVLLALAALGAAVISLLADSAWLQLAPLAVIIFLVLIGAYLQARRYNNHELNLQALLSICIYVVVWTAANGYAIVTFMGPTIETTRIAIIYVADIGLLLVFTALLVRGALQKRERYYCLGLALSCLLAGMLLPILDQHYTYPLAHAFMAIGFLTGVAIQWVQLREAAAHHAAH